MGWWKNLQDTLHPPPPRLSRTGRPQDEESLLRRQGLDSGASTPPSVPSTPPSPFSPELPTWREKPSSSSSRRFAATNHFLHRNFYAILILLFLSTLGILYASASRMSAAPKKLLEAHNRPPPPESWRRIPKLEGYFNGLYTLTSTKRNTPEYPSPEPPPPILPSMNGAITIRPDDTVKPRAKTFSPHPNYDGAEWSGERRKCSFGKDRAPPEVRVFAGVPEGMPDAVFGSADELGMQDRDVCYERYGRLGSYGYGYPESEGGLGIAVPGNGTVTLEAEAAVGWGVLPFRKRDWRGVDWGRLQSDCFTANKARFEHQSGKKNLPRTAVLLRTWTGYRYTPDDIASLRALISELSILSGGEYTVHILLHVKDPSIPIFSSKDLYTKTLQSSGLPEEFWSLATLWNEPLMRTFYSSIPDHAGKFKNARLPLDQLFRRLPLHEVYRSTFMPVQWFAQQHPEYDFVWNWEMDVRYTGHYYHLFSQLDQWTRKQPREGLWERNAHFYIPSVHGPRPEGNGTEPADLITLNPLFDPQNTTWILRDDHTGYASPPERRTAIITSVRLSKQLLQKMHDENLAGRHMFSEMWPGSVAKQFNFKAVFAPHPMWVDRKWPLSVLERTFNGDGKMAPWGLREEVFEGVSWFYNAKFGASIYRRWAGIEGGDAKETRGRMCLRGGWLIHPVKS